MAAGIAEVCAKAGFDVVVRGRSKEKAEGVAAAASRSMRRLVEKGRLSEEEMVAAVAPFGDGPELVDFSSSLVPVCRGGEVFASGGSPIACRVTEGEAPGIATDLLIGLNSLAPGCGGARSIPARRCATR